MSLSSRIKAADAAFAAVAHFYFGSRYGQVRSRSDISDFTFGNPHELPLPGLTAAIRERAIPHDKNWYAYKSSEAEPQAYLAEHVGRELELPFEPADIALTAGAFAAIEVAIRLVLDAGDEAVFSEPAWFCYEPMLLAAVLLRADAARSRLCAAEGRAQGTRVRPGPRRDRGSDRAPDAARDRELAAQPDRTHLQPRDAGRARRSARAGVSAHREADLPATSPAEIYPWTFISYSYGKILLAPGQRLGYLAISPHMPSPERQAHQNAMFSAQMALGWCFPNAVMQAAVPDVEHLAAPGRHVLPVEPVAARRPRAGLEPPGGPQRLRHAGQRHEHPDALPDQPDGVRRDGRAGAAGVRGGRGSGPLRTRAPPLVGSAPLQVLQQVLEMDSAIRCAAS